MKSIRIFVTATRTTNRLSPSSTDHTINSFLFDFLLDLTIAINIFNLVEPLWLLHIARHFFLLFIRRFRLVLFCLWITIASKFCSHWSIFAFNQYVYRVLPLFLCIIIILFSSCFRSFLSYIYCNYSHTHTLRCFKASIYAGFVGFIFVSFVHPDDAIYTPPPLIIFCLLTTRPVQSNSFPTFVLYFFVSHLFTYSYIFQIMFNVAIFLFFCSFCYIFASSFTLILSLFD